MSAELDGEIRRCMMIHFHLEPDLVTIDLTKPCSEFCVRADGGYYVLPSVGPLGVEIARRLKGAPGP